MDGHGVGDGGRQDRIDRVGVDTAVLVGDGENTVVAVDLGHRPRPPAGVGVVGVVGALPVARGPGGVVPGPGVPAGRVGGVVVDEDSRGVGQGEAHDPHRSSSDRLVSSCEEVSPRPARTDAALGLRAFWDQ